VVWDEYDKKSALRSFHWIRNHLYNNEFTADAKRWRSYGDFRHMVRLRQGIVGVLRAL
jgi:hypothetical protein